MEPNKEKIIKLHVKRTMENLEKNNIGVSYIPSAKDLPALMKKLIPEGSTVASGGSITLAQSGILDLVKNGDYTYIDRADPSLNAQEKHERNLQSFRCDVYLSSANAITERGELYLVDGSNNRVAAVLYGPEKVYIIAGCNKIVSNLEEAANRVKQLAAPANCVRLDKETFCREKGQCVAPSCDDKNLMSVPAGACTKGICSSFLVLGHQLIKERIHVLLVGEDLGY